MALPKQFTKEQEKGDEGEKWIDAAMDCFGWKSIEFDWWQESTDRLYYKGGKSILAQIKYKEPRNAYPDTGLERARFAKFGRLCNETGIRGMILFTDETGNVYGEFLENLKDEPHGGDVNKITGQLMIYFWLKDLKDVNKLFIKE